jgi:hypothetical protein
MKGRGATFLLLVAGLVLLAGPGMRLYATVPCSEGEPMACCGVPAGATTPSTPCHCSLNPVAPTHAVVETPPPDTLLDVNPALPVVDPAPAPDAPVSAYAARARAAPLFVLFVAFLN